jgi:hypothetical protein
MQMKILPGFAKKADLERFYRVVHRKNRQVKLFLDKRFTGIRHTFRSIENYTWGMHLNVLELKCPEECLHIGAVADKDVRPKSIHRIDNPLERGRQMKIAAAMVATLTDVALNVRHHGMWRTHPTRLPRRRESHPSLHSSCASKVDDRKVLAPVEAVCNQAEPDTTPSAHDAHPPCAGPLRRTQPS